METAGALFVPQEVLQFVVLWRGQRDDGRKEAIPRRFKVLKETGVLVPPDFKSGVLLRVLWELRLSTLDDRVLKRLVEPNHHTVMSCILQGNPVSHTGEVSPCCAVSVPRECSVDVCVEEDHGARLRNDFDALEQPWYLAYGAVL